MTTISKAKTKASANIPSITKSAPLVSTKNDPTIVTPRVRRMIVTQQRAAPTIM